MSDAKELLASQWISQVVPLLGECIDEIGVLSRYIMLKHSEGNGLSPSAVEMLDGVLHRNLIKLKQIERPF